MSLSLCALSIKSHALHVYSPFPPSTPRGLESCSLPPAPCLPCWADGGKLRHGGGHAGRLRPAFLLTWPFFLLLFAAEGPYPLLCPALRFPRLLEQPPVLSQNPSWKASTARRRAGAFEERGTRVWDVSEGIWEAEERHRSWGRAPGARWLLLLRESSAWCAGFRRRRVSQVFPPRAPHARQQPGLFAQLIEST